MTTWNDARVAQLKALWSEGKDPKEIAKMFRVSERAITGKAARLGLMSRAGSSNQRKPRELKKPAVSGDADVLAEPHARPAKATCRWPIGEPGSPDFRLCNQPTRNSRTTYCEKHARGARGEVKKTGGPFLLTQFFYRNRKVVQRD